MVDPFVLWVRQSRRVVGQPIEAALPCPTALHGPLRNHIEGVGVERAGPKLRMPTSHHKPRTFEHLQMLGDRGKREIERLGELADRRLTLGQPQQDPAPRAASQSSERVVQPRVVDHSHPCIFPTGYLTWTESTVVAAARQGRLSSAQHRSPTAASPLYFYAARASIRCSATT